MAKDQKYDGKKEESFESEPNFEEIIEILE
jgi:hypothetical protein